MSRLDLDVVAHTARLAVKAAGDAALPYHRSGAFAVEYKADDSPVTPADRAAEAAIIEVLRARHPDHAILGEETGAHGGSAPGRWIIDPIDGTRGFARGGEFWGPMVALEWEGEIVAGAMALPARGESWWAAKGRGCHGPTGRVRLSRIDTISQAVLEVGVLRFLVREPYRDAVVELISRTDVTRCRGDLAGVAMLLSGQADIWLEAGVALWDLAAHQILVEEAGGRFTDFVGRRDLSRGCALATNGLLHDAVLALLEEHLQREGIVEP